LFVENPAGPVILSVCERKSLLARPDQAKTGVLQYMVANVDYCFIVTALNEDYSYNRIARYASIARSGGSMPVVILTKSDLCSNVGRHIRETGSVGDGIKTYVVFARNGSSFSKAYVNRKPIIAHGRRRSPKTRRRTKRTKAERKNEKKRSN